MSIHFSDQNSNLDTLATRLDPPAGAASKLANTPAVFGISFKTPELGWELNQSLRIAARQGGGSGGNDTYFAIPQAGTSLAYGIRLSGSNVVAATSLAGLTLGTAYQLLYIVNPTNIHVICAPIDGGTPLVATHASTTLYTAGFTSPAALIDRIGGASNAGSQGWIGPLESAFFFTGAFPESGGIPDDTLIRAIATGAQDIATLDTQLTGGVKKFWYPMRHNRDLSDSFGLLADLSVVNEDKPTGKFHVNGLQLRKEAVRPSDAGFVVSQAVFATAGDMATAKANVPVQGGTYTGISPAAIQARLVKEDGTTHVNWTTVATPAAGSWAAGVLSNVPMVAGYLQLDIRAVDGGGSQLGNIVSGGVRGVGLHAINTGQSQMQYLYGTGSGLAITSGIRLVSMLQNNSGARRILLGSASSNARGAGRGIRQAALEWNALFPGVPCQFTTVGEAGQPIEQWITGGAYVGRWAGLAARFGVAGPHLFAPMGHSSGADGTYQTKFTDMIALKDAALGQALKDVLVPVPRYKRAGATLSGNALQVHESRLGMRRWHEANRTRSIWGGSWSVVTTEISEATSAADPHPGDNDTGQGRSGGLIAWACMSACRAVPDEVVGIISATGRGTSTVTLTIGRINNAPS